MSDPQPASLKNKPRRAEPLQPDSPGRGDETGSPASVDIDNPSSAVLTEGSKDPKKDGSEESQAENALKNVTEGYK